MWSRLQWNVTSVVTLMKNSAVLIIHTHSVSSCLNCHVLFFLFLIGSVFFPPFHSYFIITEAATVNNGGFFCFLPTVEIRPFPTRKKKPNKRLTKSEKLEEIKRNPRCRWKSVWWKSRFPFHFKKFGPRVSEQSLKKKATKEKQIRAKFTCL